MSLKHRLSEFYEKNEVKVDAAVFLGGFIFDVFTLTDIDDPLGILQQVIYLLTIGSILYGEFLEPLGMLKIPARIAGVWKYRQLLVHFLLGSLLSVYSLFFLKSSSLFTSSVFILFLMGLMVANELKRVQQSEVDLKIGLYVVCLFSFFSILLPVLLGFVGFVPFALSLAATGLVLYGVFRLLMKRVQNARLLLRRMIAPGGAVIALFFVFYLIGWIPPVPLSVEDMGIYHKVEKIGDQYVLSHERPYWKFWQRGDQDFVAEPGDKIFVFARIFSPARFSDAVILHWAFKDPRLGWKSTDRIPMQISGGRKKGYRGFASKQNFTTGSWRVSVETTDGREIGRTYFEVTKTETANPVRAFLTEQR